MSTRHLKPLEPADLVLLLRRALDRAPFAGLGTELIESVAIALVDQTNLENLAVTPRHLLEIEAISPEQLAEAMPTWLNAMSRRNLADEVFVALGSLYRGRAKMPERAGPPRPARDHEPGVVDPGFQSADALITALIKVAPDLVAAVVRRRLTANEAKALETLADAAADAEIAP